jgi:hypothetical protein
MPDVASPFLGPWSSFFGMSASAAATLTGLMFVVITLVSGNQRILRNPNGVSTFSTPTVVHFCAALLISSILVAPWRWLIQPATLLGVTGLLGLVYALRVMHLTRRLGTYVPDVEDWTWYGVLPFIAYGVILGGSIALRLLPGEALFALAGGVVLLIFIGIRNAWDVVTFIATTTDEDKPSPEPASVSDGAREA